MHRPGEAGDLRALGVDLGTRRIGVAVSDLSGTVASPYEVVERSGDVGRDHARLAALVQEVEAEVVVVGLPLSLSGAQGRAAQAANEEVEELRKVLPVPIEVVDERLSTVSAHSMLKAAGLNEKKRRSQVDKVAAAVILQHWLDAR